MMNLNFKTDCDPEADGRPADFGAERFTFDFSLEGGRKLSLSRGREGFDDLANLILNVLAGIDDDLEEDPPAAGS